MVATTGKDGRGKSSPPPGFDPWAVQPVAGRFTDNATPADSLYGINYIYSPVWKITMWNITFSISVCPVVPSFRQFVRTEEHGSLG